MMLILPTINEADLRDLIFDRFFSLRIVTHPMTREYQLTLRANTVCMITSAIAMAIRGE